MLREDQYEELLALYSYINWLQMVYGPIADGVFNIFRASRHFDWFISDVYDVSNPIIYSEDGELLNHQYSIDSRRLLRQRFGYEEDIPNIHYATVNPHNDYPTPSAFDNNMWHCNYFRNTKSMKAWNEFFSILQRKKPTQEERNGRAQDAAKTAVRLHVKVLKNKTPKVHVGEDHAVDQYLHFHPGFVRLITEHWVERSHQIGAKDEKNFRHVPNLDDRANQVAARRHQRNNGDIKKRIMEVQAACKRGSYDKKRTQSETALSPPPNSNRQRTDNEDPTPPTNNNNAESPQQAAEPANIQPTPPNNDNNQYPQQPTPDQIEAPPANLRRSGRRRFDNVRNSDIGSL